MDWPTFPTNFTIGNLYVYDIHVWQEASPTLFDFTALATIGVPDVNGRFLSFNISGQIGVDPFVVAFSGTQNGTWAPFPTKDLELDFLKIAYNSTTGEGHVSGGETAFGGWSIEVDLNFVKLQQAAIGFVVTSADPHFGDMPGAPPGAFDALDSLLTVGIVVSSYDGTFEFTSGANINVHPGVNFVAASVFHGITIQYTGMIHFSGGFAVSLTATVEAFQLGDGIAVNSAVITVQFPDQPFLSMSVAANWVGLEFQLVGTIGTTNIQFTGQQTAPWNINHGKTPVVVDNMLITFDHTFDPAATTGELRGTVQWGSLPAITGIMKYPADSQALGCFDLTVIIGDPSTATSLNGIVEQAVGTGDASQSFPADAGELFGNSLSSITLSVYPDCGALYLGATLQSNTFGTVNLGFAMFEYVPIQSVLASWSQGLPNDPPVPIAESSSYTVGAREVMASLANAFATVDPPILVADAYIVRQPIAQAMQQVVSTAAVMRQQLLVQLTQHAVQVDAVQLLSNLQTALGSETWKAPSHYDNATWEWDVSLQITNAQWPISEPAGLYMTDGSFALASATFQMTVGDSTIMAQKGFNFLADFTAGKSHSPALTDLEKVNQCSDKAFQVSGYVGNAEAGWFLQGALTDGCISLGSNLKLSSTSLRVQSAEPQVSFVTVMTLPQTQDMQFQVSGTFATSSGTTTLEFTGQSQSVYHTNVGKKPLDINNCNLQLSVTVGGSQSFSAQMSGAVTIDDQTDVSASASFDSSTTALAFSLTIHEEKPVLLFNLLKLLVGDDVYEKIPIPESGKDKIMGIYLVQGTMSLSTQPPSLSGGLQVLAFYKALVSASFAFNDGHVSFGFSVQAADGLLDPIKLSDILPNITIVDEFRMKTPVIILSDTPTEMTIPGIEVTYNTQTGFNFAAFLALDETTPRSTQLTKWLGNNSVLIMGVIDPLGANFELSAQAALANIPIVGGFDLTDAGFFLKVNTPKLDVGFNAAAQLVLGPGPATEDNTIKVTTVFDVGTSGASFKATITGPWTRPFGVKGVTLQSGTVELALGDNWLLGSFGISGTAQVGNVQGTVTFIAGGGLLAQTVLAAELQSVSLERDILTAICGGVPKGMFADSLMQSITFSINPSLGAVEGYPPGVAIMAKNFKVGSVTLQQVGFAVDPLRGIDIKVDATTSQTPNIGVGAGDFLPFAAWSMDLNLMLALNMGIHINGQVNLQGVSCAANVNIDITDFQLGLNFTSGPVSIVLNGKVGSGDAPFNVPDLAISGSLNLNGYLQERLLYYAQQTKDQKGPEIAAIEKKIASLQADIADLQQKIAERSANDTAAKEAAVAAVKKAQDAVNSAKEKVQDLNNQIADAKAKLDKCGKYDYPCQAKYKAEILALQAALATANAALDAANAVLAAAQEALKKIPDPDVDPQIIAWKAQVLADQALIGTLQATLAADEALTNLASNVLKAGASALQPTSLTFNSVSYIAMTKNEAGQVTIVGSFLGKSISINVGMILSNADQFVQNVWASLQKLTLSGELDNLPRALPAY